MDSDDIMLKDRHIGHPYEIRCLDFRDSVPGLTQNPEGFFFKSIFKNKRPYELASQSSLARRSDPIKLIGPLLPQWLV